MTRFKLALLVSIAITVVGCQQPMNGARQPLFGNNGANSGSVAGAPSSSLFAGYQGNSGGLFQPDARPFQAQQAMNQANQLAGQVGDLNSRLNQFDSDNQNLHAQVAALQQRLQNANSYNEQLRQQLSDQLAQLQKARQEAQQAKAQIQQMAGGNTNLASYGNPSGSGTAAAGNFNGATIRANNGLMQKLDKVQLAGFKTWMDGDVIRIEGPTDRLFVSGTYQINANDSATLGRLAQAIRQHFPRQVIGVEAHWDGTPIQPATVSHHQMTATQALAVMDVLVNAGLPETQIFTMGVGSNRFRYPQGNPANRRIEIVIYPETF